MTQPGGPLSRLYPAYSTVAAVRRELPPRIRPEDLTDPDVQSAIDTQANRLDMALLRYYKLPAPPLSPPGNPPVGGEAAYMPTELERLNRFYAVGELIVGIYDQRDDEKRTQDYWTMQGDAGVKALAAGESYLAYPFLHPDGRPYFVPLAPGSPLYARHPLSGGRRLRYSYPDLEFAEQIETGRRRRW